MSCQIVSDNTINRIVWYINNEREQLEWLLKRHEINLFRDGQLDELARRMAVMNVAAYAYRYDRHDNQGIDLYRWMREFKLRVLLPREDNPHMQASADLSHYLHQCSEGDITNWALYDFLDEVRGHAAMTVVRELQLWKPAIQRAWGEEVVA